MSKLTENSMHYPRSKREPIDGEVIIKRPGKPTLKSKQGNVSDGGLYVNLPNNHDLQKGRRVEVIVVRENGTVRDMQRMSGIVIRIDEQGVAMVIYKADQLRRGDADESNLTKLNVNSPKTS
ncbi:MAG: hypothetical protein R8G33_01895 [Gammaproteobacteria bacterium]|nr:hypothetical protein [Gammaproteobacteria bacterium]